MGWFLRFFLTVVLIALFGFLGYLYINSQSVVVPDTPTIEMENIELNSLIREKKEVLKQSLEQKKLILEYQGKLLEEKKALLANRRQDIEEYIMQEIGKIKDRYQEQVDNYQAKLDLEYQELVERKEQEYLEQILVKKELYEGKLHELIKNIEDTSFAELEKYRQDIIKEYYLAKINYDLKLKFLDLSSEEKEIYLKELNELETRSEERRVG